MENLTITRISSKPTSNGLSNNVGILTVEYGDKWLNGFMDNVEFKVGDIISVEIIQNGVYTNFEYKGIIKKAPEKMTQQEEIRANVALKMVSEIIASGEAELKDWEELANRFYNYKPKKL